MSDFSQIQLLYKDQDIYIANKPAGLHSVSQNDSNFSLAALLVKENPELANINSEKGEAGLLQRLDLHSSGCILGAYTIKAWENLKLQIKKQKVNKTYLVLTESCPSSLNLACKIGSAYRGSKKVKVYPSHKNPKRALPASTTIEVFKKLKNGCCWLHCNTSTGRRHQIRAQLAYLNAPLVGDSLYGAKLNLSAIIRNEKVYGARQFILHAEFLNFLHPVNGKAVSVCAPFEYDAMVS